GGENTRAGGARSGKTRSVGDETACVLEVLQGVDADARRQRTDVDRDALAVPEDAQLLEPLDLLERARGKRGKAAQEAGAVGVQADVAKRRRRDCDGIGARSIARPRDRCTREV